MILIKFALTGIIAIIIGLLLKKRATIMEEQENDSVAIIENISTVTILIGILTLVISALVGVWML